MFEDAAVVDVISAADYNQYLTGEYVRGADGKPTAYIAPEPTAEEQKAKNRQNCSLRMNLTKKNS